MKLQRFDMYHIGLHPSGDGGWCDTDDVARLEASHAELLDIVKGFLRWWDSPLTVNGGHIDRIRAVIAKAEGDKT